VRDAIFAALTLHIFYRNADIVDFTMETQLSNLLQSLFETDGARFYKTPTFYAMKLLKEHLGQYPVPLLPDDLDDRLDAAASMNAAGDRITVSLVNTDLYEAKTVRLQLPQGDWQVEAADVLTAADVHDSNSFEEPLRVCAAPFAADPGALCLPPHSLVRICLKK
jgi:alpha-N-arabinofuranosidase